jgi:eukaryotic-like serine/threonine-protein kinase
MALFPGAKLGPYDIVAPLGAGGMGEVYRARDIKLGRDVALKVVPEAFAQETERIARFQREAQVLAALNHPNVAAIYGFEDSGKIHALVMELVEGPTLADRIKEGALSPVEALQIGKQICEGLEYAHERGIVHRDLKPANVKVTSDGAVKLLDFGLAKALESVTTAGDISTSPTISRMATQAGVILGTAAYMSPEQARGKAVDRRADIWAFGCVLYEMLTGKVPFGGDTVTDTLAAVIKEEPSLDRLPSATPLAIRNLLRRCLDKNPRQRLCDIGEARIAIEQVLAGAPKDLEAGARLPHTKGNWKIVASAVALTAVLAYLAALRWGSTLPAMPLLKLEIPVQNMDLDTGQPLSFSPDGKKIAYISKGRVWIRFLDQLEPREVPGSEGAVQITWSPDSTTVAFATAKKISKFSIRGGEPINIADVPGQMSAAAGIAWEANDQIILTTGFTGLLEVSSQGGNPVPVLDPDPKGEADFHGCNLLPNGRGIILVVHRKAEGPDTIAVFTGKTKKGLLTLPGENLFGAVYSPTGHILFRQSSKTPGLWAVPFSLAKLEATGKPFLVAPDAGFPSSSAGGMLAYIQGANARLTQLVWVDRNGKTLGTIGQPAVQAPVPSLAPDETRVAIAAEKENSPSTNVWVQDITRGTRTLLASESTNYRFTFPPSWSPAGDSIAYQVGSNQTDLSIVVKAADGTGAAERLVSGISGAFSRDGKYFFFSSWNDEKKKWGVWYLPLQGDRKPVPFLEADSSDAVLSPDGHSLAYASNESGRSEIYIRPFPSGESRLQVSVNGGDWPHWNRRGDELYFAEGSDIMVVEVKTGPKLALSPPRKLFTRQLNGIGSASGRPDGFDVTGDGKRFLLLQEANKQTTGQSIVVVQNWIAEFQDRTKN